MKTLSIAESIELMHPSGTPFELRLLNVGRVKVIAGIFNDPAAAASQVEKFDGVAAACYLTLNPVKDSVAVKNGLVKNPKNAVNGDMIDCRRWILLDFDPYRRDPKTGEILFEIDPKTGEVVVDRKGDPKRLKCPSTADELAFALERRDQVADYLETDLAWPSGVKGMSANGGHILFRSDLPNTEEMSTLISNLLRALAARFGDDLVEVDTKVFDPNRITKLYGTIAKKGKATAERPFRRSFLEAPTGDLRPVPLTLIEALAADAPPPPKGAALVETEAVPTKGEAKEWETAAKERVGEFYDIEEVKRRNPIVDVAQDLGLVLKAQGTTGNHVAACPAHEDHGRPNFTLNNSKGGKCFSCDFKCDSFGLVMKVKSFTFGEALRYLAARVGLEPTKGQGQEDSQGQGGKSQPKPPKAAPLPSTPSPYLAGVKEADQVVDADKARTNPPPWPPRQSVAGVEAIRAFFAPYGGLPSGPIEAYNLWEELEALLDKPTVTAAEWDRAFAIGCRVGYRGDLPTVGETTRASEPNRVEVFTALLEYTSPISTENDSKGARLAAAWLEDEKGILAPTIARFGLCWLDWEAADPGMKKRFGVETLKRFGLISSKDELAFRYHRLLTPFTWQGKPVFLQGRNFIAKGGATWNSRFTNPSGAIPLPFNADDLVTAKETGKPVFLCEGVTDTLTLAQSGRLAVGIVGTQSFQEAWARYFAGLQVYLAFDGDEAGRRAGRDVSKVFVAHNLAAPKVVPIPDGLDVTELFRQGRKEQP